MALNKKFLLRRGSAMLRKDKQSLCLASGFIIGIYLGLLPDSHEGIACTLKHNNFGEDYIGRIKPEFGKHGLPGLYTPLKRENNYFILIGVMTAKKYLNSRIIASFQTWAKNIPGKVLYFSSEGSETIVTNGVPVIGLKGVDDSYPPQKKSFLMIKYMFEYFGDQFQWFVRADDDVYIKADKMEALLNSINSSMPHYIGQAGLGNKDEFGMLNLDKKENYCMGGPGMVFSRAALMKMVPHISFCLKNLYTTHEDVEIGRCIQKVAEVSCTWAYEMQYLFYHNHKEPNGSFTHTLKTKDTDRAITLHPVKNHVYQFRLHNHFKSMDSQKLRHSMLLLQRQINVMDELLQDRDAFYSPNRLGLEPSLLKYVPKSRNEVISWEFLGKSVYSHKTVNPRPGITSSQKYALDDIIRQVMNLINHNARQRGRTIDFKEILYGYKRVDPLHSADYVLDLLLVYRKHKGRKMTIPVRRHAYLQQTFSEIEFEEDIYCEDNENRSKNVDTITNSTLIPNTVRTGIVKSVVNKISNFIQRNQGDINSQLNKSNLLKITPNPSLTETGNRDKVLHFIMPLSGRYDTFLSFMTNFEEVALKHEHSVVLSVMLFENEIAETNAIDKTIAYLQGLQKKYPRHRLDSVKLKGPFSRGLGLEQGSLLFHSNALLVFIDVDMFIHRQSLNRIKKNTIQGKQIYFPIVFSQFDPAMYCNNTCLKRSHHFHYDDITGYWRQFGFGIAAMYNSDFQSIGGFDKSIQGWGMEDVKLFETFSKKNYSLFRGVEPGLVHIFHPIFCDSSLETSQYQSCLGTKSQTFASVQILSQMVYKNRDILQRNEVVHAFGDTEEHGGNLAYLRVPNANVQ